MEKIKLSKEEAQAIVIAKTMNIEVVFRRHSLDTESSLWEGDLEPLNGMTLHNILSAIYNGYEVEQTPEEKAIQWLIAKDCLKPGFSEHDIVMAIKSILSKGE